MRIFIADAGTDIRLGIQMLIHQQADMTVIGIAVRTNGLVKQVLATQPDLLLINWDLPGQNLTGKLNELHARLPRIRVVVLAVRPEARSPALAAGADAFIDMNAAPDGLLDTLREVGYARST